MSNLMINDLNQSNELDHAAMLEVSGGHGWGHGWGHHKRKLRGHSFVRLIKRRYIRKIHGVCKRKRHSHFA